MKKIMFLLMIPVLILFISCSGTEKETTDDELSDDLSDEVLTESDEVNDESADTSEPDNNIETDDEAVDEESDEDSENGEFLSGFDIAGKECITDIPQGRLILTTARDYSDSEAQWRVYILILKDDGTIFDTEKYFETDPDLRGIGFNSNGRLAAISSWKTGHVTLFALIDSTLCIADTEIVLPNLKVNGEEVERVIFDEVVPHPTDPY
ncbi:MAG TPA: hypothetical protein VLJ60_09045, partial [bacterium]|nr:hypothetical protein [bacterium]